MDKLPEKIKIHPNLKPSPTQKEIEVAIILANHYNSTVEFLEPIDGYRVKTPDIIMLGNTWEIKSPTGASKKNTVKDQFSKAKGKKHHMIFDGRYIKLEEDFVLKRIRFELTVHRSIQRLLFIRKNSEVLEIK